MATIVADGRVAVVDATHDVGPRSRSYFDKSSPGVIGIGGHTGGVKKNTHRIAIKAGLYEGVVVRRDEEVVAGSDATESELDAIIKQLLDVDQVTQEERFAAEKLLNSKDVVDVICRQAAAETV